MSLEKSEIKKINELIYEFIKCLTIIKPTESDFPPVGQTYRTYIAENGGSYQFFKWIKGQGYVEIGSGGGGGADNLGNHIALQNLIMGLFSILLDDGVNQTTINAEQYLVEGGGSTAFSSLANGGLAVINNTTNKRGYVNAGEITALDNVTNDETRIKDTGITVLNGADADNVEITNKNIKINFSAYPRLGLLGNDVLIRAEIIDLINGMKGAVNGLSQLDVNQKILIANLPDFILGQLLNGGTLNANTAVATLSTNGKSKLGTGLSSITLTDDTNPITGYEDNEGIYYIVSVAGTFAGENFAVGDWCLGIGTSWQKILNSDMGDNLGNHIADQDLDLNNFILLNTKEIQGSDDQSLLSMSGNGELLLANSSNSNYVDVLATSTARIIISGVRPILTNEDVLTKLEILTTPYPNYVDNATAVADGELPVGAKYTVTIGGYKRVYEK